MQTARSPILAGLAAALLVGTAGCTSRPTFPKATMAESLQQFLVVDEGLKATVRLIERTLAVQMEFPAALAQVDGHVEIGPGFDEATRKVLTQIHRVSLSTDADIQFYVLLLSDPSTPGAYLTMVRYMDDVRRANASMLDTPEIFARTIFELNTSGPEPLTLDQYVPREIRFEEFLSWQLARRIQYALAEMMHNSGAAEVGRVGGEFQNGEFAFTLDLAPSGGEGTLDEATLQQAFQASTQIVAKVLESYHFDHFTTVRLIHPMTGRNLVLPKTSLNVFR